MPKLLPFSATSPPHSPDSALRLPANKRLAPPTAHRLNSITDPSASTTVIAENLDTAQGNDDSPSIATNLSPNPRRRRSLPFSLPVPPRRTSGASSKVSAPAPPYDWIPEPIEETHDGRVPVEGEKLRQLRREDDEGKTVLWWRRKRVWRLAVVLVVVVVGLAVGLGVGLTRRSGASDTNAPGKGNGREAPPMGFPIGKWMVPATLVEASTGCTSEADTWRCYPYVVGGATTFDLSVANTSALYAPNSTRSTRDTGPGGISANLTVSSSNRFAIPFTNQSMAYLASAGNATAARLRWSFGMTKSVMSSTPRIDGGGVAQCAFPQTMFTGTLHLAASKMIDPEGADGGVWPYAVEIRQDAQGGSEGVKCEGLGGGSVVVPAGQGGCSCVYRDY